MIRHKYICTTCRLHQRLQTQLFSLQQARRGFSVTTAAAREQYRDKYASRDRRPPYQLRSPGSQRRDRGTRYNTPYADRDNATPRGRYSGQPLQPEHVLDQLPMPRPRPHTKPSHSNTNRPDTFRAIRNEHMHLPSALRRKVDELTALRSEGAPPARLWPLVQAIAQEDGARQVGADWPFRKAYIGLVLNSCKTVGIARAKDRQGTPRPSEVLSLMGTLGITYNELWPRALWRVAKVLLEVRAKGEEQSQAVVLEELMALWNLAFSARLRREPVVPQHSTVRSAAHQQPSTKLDWSFLPPLPALIEMLEQQQVSGSKRRFDAALAMLLPEFQSSRVIKAWSTDMANEEYYEYTSAALVTIDALRREGKGSGQEYATFVAVVEALLRIVPVSGVPPALGHEIEVGRGEGSGLGRELEEVVWRMGLVHVPRSPVQQQVGAHVEGVGRANAEGRRENPWPIGTKAASELAIDPLPVTREAAGRDAQLTDASEATRMAAEPAIDIPGEPSLEAEVERRGKMLYDYEAAGEGELTIVEGQGFVVLESDGGDGWIRIRMLDEHQETENSEGFVPASYVDLEVPQNDGDDIDQAASPISTALAAAQSPTENAATTEHRDSATDRFTNLRINRLGQALQKQNLSLAEHLKTEILAFAADPSHPPLRDQLYEHLLLTLLSLRAATSAIEVWNHFVGTLGRSPTVKTYTVMMTGAQRMRDLNGMEGFWGRMRGAGVRPDVTAWTTRVFGLLKGGRVEGGLRALGEMGGEWVGAARAKKAGMDGGRVQGRKGGPKQAQPEMPVSEAAALFDGDIDGVPRPNAITMNAAISALASRADQHIPKVLAWGRVFGLEPDQTTYNVLLNISMRHGDTDEAIAILRRMQERDIETSSETWTVLLAEVFEGRSLESLSHGEQTEKILTLLSALETAGPNGTGIDQKGYALVVDRLLKYYSNTSAANAVLAHMVERDVQPTPHLYTILMTSYFQRQPEPDLRAVEALWHQILAANGGRGAVLDSVFYDRMLEGWAAHHRFAGGAASQMLRVLLERMRAEGRRPSWRALELVVRCWAERGEWDNVLKVVDEARAWVKDERATAPGRSAAEMLLGERNYGQRDFWQFIVETEVLRDEGIESPDQFMRARTGMSPFERRMGGA